MLPDERIRAKERVAKALRLLLHDIENFSSIPSLGVVTNDVALLGRDDHADLRSAGSNHALDHVLGDCLRTLHSIDHPRSDGKKLFRTAEWLNALPSPGCGNDADHASTSL